MTIHQPVVAGMFYPAQAGPLRAMVADLLAGAPALDVPPPKAVILPHAGYRYSGSVAAAGAATLAPGVRRVVVLGPSHRFAFRGVALPAAAAMRTPLGDVPIDADAVRALLREPEVRVLPQAHAAEHSIEVELPFLQHRLGDFSIVPLVVGEIGIARLAEIVETLWGGDETLIVVSSDMSHYLPYAAACRRDRGTADAILRLEASLVPEDACGAAPINGLLRTARKRALRVEEVDLRNSGDTAGDRDRVVGYAAFAFCEGARA